MRHFKFLLVITSAMVLTAEASTGQSTLTQDAKIWENGLGSGAQFGIRASRNENMLLVGTNGSAGSSAIDGAEAAYLYEFSSGIWGDPIKFIPWDNPSTPNRFGLDVEIAGDIVAIGAHLDGEAGADRAGAVYVFHFNSEYPPLGQWEPELKILNPDGLELGVFGHTLSLFENTLAVSSHGGGTSIPESVYFYERDPFSSVDQWSYISKVSSPTDSDDEFGYSIDVYGNYAIVGAPKANSNSGKVYLLEYLPSSQNWVIVRSFEPTGDTDFGRSLVIDGDLMAIGSPGLGNDRGAVYIYRYYPLFDSWFFEERFVPPIQREVDGFGGSVSIDGGTIAVGASGVGGSSNLPGIAFIYRYSSGRWLLEHECVASDGRGADGFGEDIILTQEQLVVGAPFNDSAQVDSGAIYVYDLEPRLLLQVAPNPAVSLDLTSIQVKQCTPLEPVFVVYSTNGYGSTPVPSMNIELDLYQVQYGLKLTADFWGEASFTGVVPEVASALNIWLQALQFGKVSNVVEAQIMPYTE